MQEAASIGAGK